MANGHLKYKQLSTNRGPHRKIINYLISSGPQTRYEIRQAFYTYGETAITNTINAMLIKGIAKEIDGKITLDI